MKSGSVALEGVAMAKDLGAVLAARVRYDATAGAGIANRRGVGRVRHLHTPALWIQRHVQEGGLLLSKVDGDNNLSDLGTSVGRIGFGISWRAKRSFVEAQRC